MIVGLSGLTAGLVTVGYVLEKEKRAAMEPRSQLQRVLDEGDEAVVMFGTTQCSFCHVAHQLLDLSPVHALCACQHLRRPYQETSGSGKK